MLSSIVGGGRAREICDERALSPTVSLELVSGSGKRLSS